MENVTFSIGNLALIDKVDARTGFFGKVFRGLGGRAKDFVPHVKLLLYNRLGETVSVSRLADFISPELAKLVGFTSEPATKQTYRAVERLGRYHAFVLSNYQEYVKGFDAVTQEQLLDFSAGYFEGSKSPLGALGYSRDGQPGKPQITFGVSVGINGVPTALTIQKGNTVDKKHMRSLVRVCSKILQPNSLLIFDCGGNTKKVKEQVTELGFGYLTLKAKKRGAYAPLLREFHNGRKQSVKCGDVEYSCLKTKSKNEALYVFYSQKLHDDQLRKKKRKFEKALAKGEKLLKKVRKNKELDRHVCKEGWIIESGNLQKNLQLDNPFVTGLEGYFVLESTLDANPAEILQLYKNRDKAEKLIRDLKEGAELRPFRHWTQDAVIGIVLIVFLTSALARLTQLFSQNPLAKNLKLLKKYLTHLTLSVVHLKNGRKMTFISNFSEEMKAFFGNFLQKYVRTTLSEWV